MTDATSKNKNAPAKPSFGLADFGLSPSGAIAVKKVDKYGSIGKAGIIAGDEIVAIGGAAIPKQASVEHIQNFIAHALEKVGVGGTLMVRVVRQGKSSDVSVTVKAKKELSLDVEEVSEVLERKIAP